MRRRASWSVAALTVSLLLMPAVAQARATKPGVVTGGAASVAQTTATLTGSVDPNGAATTYFFQYGTTSLYGAQTAPTAAGHGTKPGRVAVPVGALAPFTRYHYRLVAMNAKGLTKGHDRTFRTLRQPLGLTLGALPNPVAYGHPTTLGGTLSGTGNAGRQVVLQANPFPYTQGFLNVTNVQLTNTLGQFAFTLPSVALNTQFRVLMPTNPAVASPIVAVGVAPLLSTHVRVRRGRHGGRVRFYGTVRPALDGVPVSIQKLHRGAWVTIARTITRHSNTLQSTFRRRVRQRRGGSYRVLVEPPGNFAPVASRTRRVHVHRR
jgi:hypothetical protein